MEGVPIGTPSRSYYMKIIRRDPEFGYLDSELWLPKKYVSELQIRAALTFITPKDAIIGWKEEVAHYRVPRNFFSRMALPHLPYQIIDTRHKDYRSIPFKSSVVLDSKEPHERYQRDAVAALLRTEDGILCLRCGAGKTVVTLDAIAKAGGPALIIVSDKGLAQQWLKEIEKFLGIKAADVGRIGGEGAPFRWKGTAITIALVQTLARRASEGTLPPEMLKYFKIIVPDEAHLMGAPYFNKALPPFHGQIWALTATPTREDAFDSLLKHTVGGVVYSYLKPALKPVFVFKRLGTNPPFEKKEVRAATHDVAGNLHFGMLYGYLATDDVRCDEIADDVRYSLGRDRNILILTHSRAMIDSLEKRFPKAGVVHSDVPEKERLRRIRECNPVIAIMQLGKQALDKPELDTVYMCEPTTKKGALQQIMGRALRVFLGKKAPMIIIIEDVNITPMKLMCHKIRAVLARWPDHKGGKIPFKIIKPRE